MKRLIRFCKQYKLFSMALLALIAALALEFSGKNLAVKWVLGVTAIYEVIPFLWNMWQDFRAGSYGINILAASAIVTSVLFEQFWAAIVIALMLTGGKALEHYAQHRAKSELKALLKHAPLKAHVIHKGKVLDVKVKEIHVGDKVLIKPGEVVPVDALIIEGTARFDEARLTGESLAQAKQVKDQILSGSINVDGTVTAKALANAEDSQYQQIIKLVRGASASKAPYARLAARYSLPFTFAAYAIATTAWVLSGQAIRFLEVIVVATPCSLLLAVPIALMSGMSRASRYGIIIKTGSALERLADAQTIAFDKTGTLTMGKPQIASVRAYGTMSQADVLGFAASLEQNSTHTLAQSIIESATNKKIKLIKTKHAQEISGQGIQATIKGRRVLIGRFGLIEKHGVKLPPRFKDNDAIQTAVYVAVDDELVGIISLIDEQRPESKATLGLLKKLGFHKTMIITGDNDRAAKTIANALGIRTIHANMLPADKLLVLDGVTDRPLVFVGNGINDAPALTASDVGIALGARGSTAASESADIVIMADNISYVAKAAEIAKRTLKIAQQSILVGTGLSLVLMLVYATGKFTPLSGAIVQVVVNVLVIFNALRAHSGKVTAIQ